MTLLGIGYLALAVILFLFVGEFVSVLNIFPTVFRFGEPLPVFNERFWSTLAAANALMLALLSFFSARSPGIKGYFLMHLAAKVFTASAFFYLFFHDKPYFAYFLGGSFDASVGIFVLWKSVSGRSTSVAQTDAMQTASETGLQGEVRDRE